MMRLFLIGQARAWGLWLRAWVSPWREQRSVTGTVTVILLWPVFVALQWLHLFGFAVDEVLFRGWRRVEIRAPLFILGPPRSGTTHLHRVLSLDSNSTTFRLWECLFGLSVTGRKIALAAATLDRRLGRPAQRLMERVNRRLLSDLEEVHPLSLDAPEEDFLTLMPFMQCFILITVFPGADWLWRTAHLDRTRDTKEAQQLMRFYRDCIRKHLYTFGQQKRFLSKNASFSGMAEALLETFPDARILVCDRDPRATVPSQLSALQPGLEAVGFDRFPDKLKYRLIELLAFYYLHLDEVAGRHPMRVVVVRNEDLRNRLARTVRTALQHLRIEISPAFDDALGKADRASRGFRSSHRYALSNFGLDERTLDDRLADVHAMRARRAGT